MNRRHIFAPEAPDIGAFRLETIRTDAALAALRQDWEALYRRAADPVPFASYGWIHRCWERQRAGGRQRLNLATIRKAGRLILVAPFVAHRNPMGLIVLNWLDSGTPCYSDLLMEASSDGRLGAEFLAVALANDLTIGRIRLNAVVDDAAAQHFLQAIGARTRTSIPIHRIVLPEYGDWNGFLAAIDPEARGSFRRFLRRLADRGEVVFEAVTRADEAAGEVASLFAWKGEAFAASETRADWLFAPETLDFFRRAAVDGIGDGSCVVYRLRVGGHTIASDLVFRGPGRLYLSKMAFDPAWGRHSPGRLCKLLLLQRAFAEGVEIVDLMSGEFVWKQRLSNRVTACSDYRIPGRLFRLGGR